MKKILFLLVLAVSTNVYADCASDLTGVGIASEQAAVLCSSQVAHSVSPSVTNTYDLGTSALNWRNVYLRKIIFGGTSGRIVPASTELIFRNNADDADNLAILDAGTLTISRSDAIIPTAAKGLVIGEAARAANVVTVTGTGTPLYVSSPAATLDAAAIVGTGANASGPTVDNFKTRATSGQASTIVQSGDTLGQFRFFGANGTTYDPAAAIVATVGGTPGATTDMPGKLEIKITPDGSATLATVLGLLPTGQVSIAKAADLNFTVGAATIALQESTAGTKCMGTATANGTTAVPVATTCATTGSRIFISRTSTIAVGVVQPGCWATNIVNATSFDLDCSDTAENSTFDWIIIHEANAS